MVIAIEDMRLGRVLKFTGFSDREGDINFGEIVGTAYVRNSTGVFYVPVRVDKLADGSEDKRMIICSENIIEVRDD